MKRSLAAWLFLAISAGRALAIEPGSFRADGPRDGKAVALTFDDGPGPFTRPILDILDRYQIKATFFLSGDQVLLRPEIAQEVAARGHEIGEHTFSHVNFYSYEKKHGPAVTQAKIRDEIARSKSEIQKATGRTPLLCRMPHGFQKPWMGAIAKEYGYALVNWTFGEDWTSVPQDKMAQDYIQVLKPGAILLFHDGGKKREKTVAILPQVIEAGRKRGFSFVTAGDLLK